MYCIIYLLRLIRERGQLALYPINQLKYEWYNKGNERYSEKGS